MTDQYLLLIGAMKGGTTSLHAMLDQHPDIRSARLKEPNFFGDPALYRQGYSWYRGLWPSKADGWLLDGSTFYAKAPAVPDVPRRIADTQAAAEAEFRFVYMLRDPVERIRSHLGHLRRHGSAHVATEEASPLHPHLLDLSRYAMQLDPYRSLFGTDKIHLTSLEALREDPSGTFGSLCSFLGLETIEVDLAAENRGEGQAAAPSWLHPFLRSRMLHRHYHRLPRWLLAGGRAVAYRAKASAIDLTDEEKHAIWHALAADQRRLRDEYGFDTSRWSGP